LPKPEEEEEEEDYDADTMTIITVKKINHVNMKEWNCGHYITRNRIR
jgi:hypothetical protein